MTVPIATVPSCSNLRAEHRGAVVVSGSYGGNYNACNAARAGVRAVIMNDAGVGRDRAGIRGLDYLDRMGIAAATVAADSCHIGDGDDALAHGIISHVNEAAAALGCAPAQSTRTCADLMKSAPISHLLPPAVAEGGRFVLEDARPRIVCVDTAGMIVPTDAGDIVITGSHGALPGGRPDNVVCADLRAVFFSDGGIDEAGVARLADLDRRQMIAGAISVASAPIGDARSIYRYGVLSRVNAAARRAGAEAEMSLREFVAIVRARAA
ncbi:MAG TPA: hypothetical protein VG894_10995 [Bauldia sp.]|nr:hypothetical protein [Bauldia sp.]